MAEGAEKHLDNLPEDWGTRRIGDICNVVRGASPRPAGDPRYFGGEYVPWLTVASLTGIPRAQIEVKGTEGALTKEGAKRSRVLEAGTVIIANSGATLGVAKQLGITCCANDGIAALQNLSDGNKKFVIQFINTQTKRLRERVATGVGQPNLNTSLISKIQIPFPPPDEQEAIAEALSDVDALLTSIDAAIEKKRNVKTATMQRLLTGEERLPGFKGEWGEYRVGDIFQFLKTANNPRRDLSPEGTVQYLHYGDLHTGMGPHLDCRDQPLPTIEEKRIGSADWIRDGDLVMADASEDYEGVGKSVEMRGADGKKVVAGLHTLLLRGRVDALADGFKGYIQYIPEVRRKLRRIATGTSVYGLSKSKLRDVEISLPQRDEQRAIAEILSDMDAEIEAWEKRRAKTQAVKTGMMQELLTGETRLV
ncbi:type I restriction enzyme S subunit [Salinibacter ruber]|uniref:restriction endonuclease subunit S n=1 Tax=Salinibacter ruber TaxID=146919 RepID=UPI00216913DB|nr:restriction endonuclease subunit S [Salinibacter ruber]MCS3632089.1 type I restriction enzyme S subunit [Salinibacter ruber]